MNSDKPYKIKIDNVSYEWIEGSIKENELRDLACIPENAQLFQKIPGHPDKQVLPECPIDLTIPGTERFCSAVVGSQAG
ncbi:hypothetical protein MNBD_GAMMA12-1357 [hydrothermal vent metagenome]|uniref:Uncharacterized protein n=1 Tax=hydrothermal vent metagenome TaxID=652676 RepID=A0A3B0YKG3_9ZZZZ